MSTTHERHPMTSEPASIGRPDATSVLLLVTACFIGLLSLAVGVVLSYFAFPEPTMWRLTIVAAVLVCAVLPLRLMVASAGRHAERARQRDWERFTVLTRGPDIGLA